MLTISIPDEIDNELSSLTDDKKEFIISAIKQKIGLQKKCINLEELAKEYRDSISENEEVTKDFKHADKGNWNDY
jgi:uncharacterized FlgJ-related protein